ncbi:MAG: hypothetical protein ACYCWE_21535 [Eubacteriales bacterium]
MINYTNNRLKQYPDLYKYSIIRSLKRLSVTILWYAFWFFVYYKYFILSNKSLFGKNATSQVLVFIIIIIILLFPFLVFKVHKLLTDKSYDGIIKEIKQEYKVKNMTPGSSYINNMKEHECIIIITEDNNGKSHEFIYWKKDDIDNQAYFKVGAKVTHYKELKYLHNIDRAPGEHLCVVCGQLVFNERDTCARCKHSFIK